MQQNGVTMAIYGYARVSTGEQDLTIQREALLKAGCTIIREEKRSGTSRDGRTELETLMAFLRPGDVLMVTRMDRLARSMRDLQNIVGELKDKGVALKATEQPIDTGSAAGKAFLDMLGVFAEFETNLRRERQLEGIAKAKVNGIYAGKGRHRSVDRDGVARLSAEGTSPTEIARLLGINRVTVYRVLAEAAGEKLNEVRRARKDNPPFAARAASDTAWREHETLRKQASEPEAIGG